MTSRIALIHATALSIAPIEAAFAERWPEAELLNLLDDSLSRDRDRDGALTELMINRFIALGDYAVQAEAAAILFTCSAFAGAIEAVRARLSIPVLKPNAMLDEALGYGSRVGLVATFAATVDSMSAELEQLAGARALQLHTRLANGAMAELGAGRADRHDQMVVAAAADLPPVDVILLAQFSMARAREQVAARCTAPVLTTPASAVAKLRRLLD